MPGRSLVMKKGHGLAHHDEEQVDLAVVVEVAPGPVPGQCAARSRVVLPVP